MSESQGDKRLHPRFVPLRATGAATGEPQGVPGCGLPPLPRSSSRSSQSLKNIMESQLRRPNLWSHLLSLYTMIPGSPPSSGAPLQSAAERTQRGRARQDDWRQGQAGTEGSGRPEPKGGSGVVGGWSPAHTAHPLCGLDPCCLWEEGGAVTLLSPRPPLCLTLCMRPRQSQLASFTSHPSEFKSHLSHWEHAFYVQNNTGVQVHLSHTEPGPRRFRCEHTLHANTWHERPGSFGC